MFNVAHQGRKYVPTRSSVTDDCPVTARCVQINKPSCTLKEAPEATWPPSAKMRISKGNKGAVVRVRRNASPQPASLEELEASWSDRGQSEVKPPESLPSPEAAGNGIEGGPPRNRKKGFRPPDVRTIFSPGEKDPRVKDESGEGHTFEPGGNNTWCDVCCQYIFYHGLTCAGCKYTCHTACRDRVSLDCHPAASVSQDQLNNNTPPHDVEKERELRTEFSREEIRQKVEQYNKLTTDLLKMTLNHHTGVYTGFIKVQMDLRRPVTVRGGQRGAGGALVEEAFYLPRGVTNTLHISSNNTVRQVIIALLSKFTVADNPAKYALYKRYRREEQVYVCKLADGEQPLFLRLVAGPDSDTLSFVLREQQTGEVMWDAFSIPELCNFLRILDKEEDEQKVAVIRRYEAYRQRLQEALREVRGPS
ncbi:ras association domain-containing protein 1 [Micropterus dolomieu]|uniref:ras association domain-containing protein 1 n=1 Tax=Micropterus dolomieu TaxID=147949 RepID=UPI001E8CD8E6|nr:ras association domain-containing protein 1 [Micropterus dolomieu]